MHAISLSSTFAAATEYFSSCSMQACLTFSPASLLSTRQSLQYQPQLPAHLSPAGDVVVCLLPPCRILLVAETLRCPVVACNRIIMSNVEVGESGYPRVSSGVVVPIW